MRVACAYCGGVVHQGELGPYRLCSGCFRLLEDELTAAAVRVGRVGRHDAETVADMPLPVLLTVPLTRGVENRVKVASVGPFRPGVCTLSGHLPDTRVDAPMDDGQTAGHLRVLVVDDDPDAADSTALLITLAGFDVRTAASGEEVLQLADEYPPDVVLLDLMMPGMDGHELAGHLRERFAFRRPFLVAVSGCVTPDEHRRSAAAGLDLHLDKPVEPAVLVGVLKRFARVLAPA